MNIVIPMAGQGKRFSDSGFSLPKPLISVAGKPMYRHAVDCLPLHLATNLVFILRKNDFSEVLQDDIQTSYGALYPCTIVELPEDTRGQAETILKGGVALNQEVPTLIHNCDTSISQTLPWSSLLKSSCDGAIVVFSSQEQRWSYVKLNSKKTEVLTMKEKEVISSEASTGTYFFRDTALLLRNIQVVIDHQIKEKNEYYLSSVYSLMIQQSLSIIPVWSKVCHCFGTPMDLVNTLNRMLEKLSSKRRL